MDRCLKSACFGNVVYSELHHFCDASEQDYRAVSYLRSVNANGEIHCSFVLGKSRVTPLKKMTLPRLEPAAATVGVKIDKMIARELDIKVCKSTFWTGSTSVLQYIHNEDKRFHTFVANRIATIHDGSEPFQWRYINTKFNPADDAVRGLSVDNLINNSRWVKGSEFLWEAESMRPSSVAKLEPIPESDSEVKRAAKSYSIHVDFTKGMTNLFFSKFSNWKKLQKSAAWMLRYKEWIMERVWKKEGGTNKAKTGRITVEEMQKAEHCIISCVQKENLAEEINRLRSVQSVKY